MLIRDVVTLDEYVSEHSVVQIEFFSEQEKNRHLLKSFIFTRHAPQGKCSSLDILHRLYECARSGAVENVYCLLANYGHGKSHFGLVLANFFGKPYDSDEFQTLMDKIEHSAEDAVRVQSYREFRQSRKPYLVIRLRGDDPYPLSQQFLNATKRALGEHGITGNLRLWYERAAEWLEKQQCQGTHTVERINRILEQHGTDLPMLVRRVREYDHSTYHIVMSLHRDLHGTIPHFEGEVDANGVLDWLVNQYCQREDRFGGVLILFDEFAAFLHNYARSNQILGSMQRLLETVDAHRQHTLFVAFAQIDPRTVIDTEARGNLHNELVRELQRIPQSNILQLHSRLELVMDAYLRQDEQAWNMLRRQRPDFDDYLFEATNLAMDCFPTIYSEQLKWTQEQFEEVVTRGCFPLHPLTTAILCNASLGGERVQLETPRTVLGFVVQAVRNCLNAPVYHNGRPNWILPVSLVDYFEEMLPEYEYQQYRHARGLIEGVPTPEQEAILKAILLITVSQIPVRRTTFMQIVSHLSGYDEKTVGETLQKLCDTHVLYNDRGNYRFWPTGGDSVRLKQLRDEVMAAPPSGEDVERLREQVDKDVEVPVDWGATRDWAATQEILHRGTFTADRLRKMAPVAHVDQRRLLLHRGLVVRLIAFSEEDVQWFRENAERIMDEAFPEGHPPAVMVLVPTESHEEILKNLRWDWYLDQSISPEDRQRIGEQMLQVEISRLREQRKHDIQYTIQHWTNKISAVSMLRRGELTKVWQVVVPQPYRSILSQEMPLDGVLQKLYSMVYCDAPPFFKQYDHARTNLRKDIYQICIKLADNRLPEIVDTLGNGPGKDCIKTYLLAQWNLLDSNYRVQEPSVSSKVRKAWDLLDSTFKDVQTSTPVKDVLLRLMNPPYGYHYHQLALLFSAWCGYHKINLQVSVDGRQSTIRELWTTDGIDRSEKFLESLIVTHQVTLKWTKSEDVVNRAQRILQGEERLPIVQAQQLVEQFEDYLAQDVPTDVKQVVSEAAEKLKKQIEQAQDYDRKVQEIHSLSSRRASLPNLIDAYFSIPQQPTIVTPDSQETPTQIQEMVLQLIWAEIEERCRQAENLSKIEEVALREQELKYLLSLVKQKIGIGELIERVEQATERFRDRHAMLIQEHEEAENMAKIKAMSADGTLATVYQFLRELENIHPRSEKACKLHSDKQQELEQAVQRYQRRLEDWRNRLGSYIREEDLEALTRLRDEILQNLRLYEDTNEQMELKELQSRCELSIVELERKQSFARLLRDIERITDRDQLVQLRAAIERRLQKL